MADPEVYPEHHFERKIQKFSKLLTFFRVTWLFFRFYPVLGGEITPPSAPIILFIKICECVLGDLLSFRILGSGGL